MTVWSVNLGEPVVIFGTILTWQSVPDNTIPPALVVGGASSSITSCQFYHAGANQIRTTGGTLLTTAWRGNDEAVTLSAAHGSVSFPGPGRGISPTYIASIGLHSWDLRSGPEANLLAWVRNYDGGDITLTLSDETGPTTRPLPFSFSTGLAAGRARGGRFTGGRAPAAWNMEARQPIGRVGMATEIPVGVPDSYDENHIRFTLNQGDPVADFTVPGAFMDAGGDGILFWLEFSKTQPAPTASSDRMLSDAVRRSPWGISLRAAHGKFTIGGPAEWELDTDLTGDVGSLSEDYGCRIEDWLADYAGDACTLILDNTRGPPETGSPGAVGFNFDASRPFGAGVGGTTFGQPRPVAWAVGAGGPTGTGGHFGLTETVGLQVRGRGHRGSRGPCRQTSRRQLGHDCPRRARRQRT